MKRLIVNADDFGLTAGVNRGILELNQAGALTSTTLMATASATQSAVRAVQSQPSLGVGCHLIFVDGQPALPPDEIPTLLDPCNPSFFRPTLGRFVSDLLRGRIREADIEAEALAQIRKIQRAGVLVTHVDTHKHTHMFPRVLRPVLRAAMRAGINAIRNPFEPAWSRAATSNAGWGRRLQVCALNTQLRYFSSAVAQAGIATTDGALGVLATGTLDAPTLRSLLARMPSGTWELVCHPGYTDAALDSVRTRLTHSRETERAALLEVLPAAVASDPQLSLIHFGQLRHAKAMAAGSLNVSR